MDVSAFRPLIAGIVIFNTVWGALAGIVLSAVLVFAIFHAWIFHTTGSRAEPAPITLPLLTLVPASAGYGLMVLVSNLDVLFGYFVLSQTDLGLYSGSSVFPKAALVVITPLLQMLIPGDGRIGPGEASFLVRGCKNWRRHIGADRGRIGACLAAFRPAVRQPLWTEALRTAAAFDASGFRCSLVLAAHPGCHRICPPPRLWLLWLAVPAVAYSLFIWVSQPGMDALAIGFAIFSNISFAFFAAVCFVAQISRRRALARSSAS